MTEAKLEAMKKIKELREFFKKIDENYFEIISCQSLYNNRCKVLGIKGAKTGTVGVSMKVLNEYEGYYLYKVGGRYKAHVDLKVTTDVNDLTKYPNHKNKKGVIVEAIVKSLFFKDRDARIKLFIEKSEFKDEYSAFQQLFTDSLEIEDNGFVKFLVESKKKIITGAYKNKTTGKIVKECSTQEITFSLPEVEEEIVENVEINVEPAVISFEIKQTEQIVEVNKPVIVNDDIDIDIDIDYDINIYEEMDKDVDLDEDIADMLFKIETSYNKQSTNEESEVIEQEDMDLFADDKAFDQFANNILSGNSDIVIKPAVCNTSAVNMNQYELQLTAKEVNKIVDSLNKNYMADDLKELKGSINYDVPALAEIEKKNKRKRESLAEISATIDSDIAVGMKNYRNRVQTTKYDYD